MYTENIRYIIPDIHHILSQLGDAKVFSSIDLLSGFTHVPVDEESRKYLAFTTPKGHFIFSRLPQGLKQSPSVFSHTMS